MTTTSQRRTGFSIIELVVSSSLFTLAVSMAVIGYSHVLRQVNSEQVQDELDIQVQTAIERLKYNMRLSALNKMFFSPEGPGPYTAVSFPMARDDDGDGAVDTDENDDIIWDRTVIYHVWPGAPSQLRQTVFDPRDNTLSDVERQAQLDAVVLAGHGTNTHNGANVDTDVVFENLFEWSLSPEGAVFDGYAPTQTRAANVRLGSCVLSGGSHQLTFTVIGQNGDSSGFHVGIDSLAGTPSHSIREGEALLPSYSQLGGIADYEYMEGGAWSGNYQLNFPATGAGDYFTLNLESDLWQERNFQSSGDSHDNTTLHFDTSTDPGEFVVTMEGLGTNWSAEVQTGDTTNRSTAATLAAGAAIRVLVRGEEMVGGNWITWDAARARVCWRAGTGPDITIGSAYIGEADNTSSNTMDVAAGTQQALTFGGSSTATLPAGGELWSDYADYPIEKEKSYLVSYRLAPTPAGGRLRYWQELTSPAYASTFIIPPASIPGDTDTAAAAWSTRGDVIGTNTVIGVGAISTTYAATGTYVSTVFDTHCAEPAYDQLNWDAAVPSGCGIQIKIRTGSSADMSDAPTWDSVSFIPNYGMIDPGNKQYVQFLAQLTSTTDRLEAPSLKEFTIEWQGEEKVVALGGTFTKGPDHGIFRVAVDGQDVLT